MNFYMKKLFILIFMGEMFLGGVYHQADAQGTKEWESALITLKQFSQKKSIELREVEPEWFAKFLPEARLFKSFEHIEVNNPSDDAGPWLLKKDKTITSLYRGFGPLFEVVKASGIILETDQDAKEFIHTFFKVLYGETRQLMDIEKLKNGWRFGWALGFHLV